MNTMSTVIFLLALQAPNPHGSIVLACGSSPRTALTLQPMAFDPSYPATQLISIQAKEGREEVYVRSSHDEGNKQHTSILRSTDGGINWRSIDITKNWSLASDDIYFRGENPLVIYKRDGPLYLRSYDAGSHWNSPSYIIDGMKPSQFVNTKVRRNGQLYAILSAVHPQDTKTIFAFFRVICPSGSNSPNSCLVFVPGLYISRDAGDHWSLFSHELLNGSPFSLNRTNPNIQFGISAAGPIRSINGGKTWLPMGEQSALASPAFPIDEDNIRAAAKELGVDVDIIRQRAEQQSKATFWKIESHPLNPLFVLLVSNKGLYQSLDGGDNWHRLSVGRLQLGDINSAMYAIADPKTIYVGTNEYIAKSSDGGLHVSYDQTDN